MEDIIIILIVAAIIAAITIYLVRAKKRDACIGCPYAKKCSGKCSGEHKKE